MAIPVQFQQFKSAGIYRVVYDRSTVLGTEAELLRLVVGYSPKGPFNTPVYVKSVSDFKAMFGDVSKTLEKRGCFFHRTCIHALEAGPILALNLKPFSEETVGCAAIGNESIMTSDKSVKEIYDTTRFWKLEPENLNDGNAYMHICAVDSKQTSTSIFVRKPDDSKVAAYNISVADWYNSYNTPIPDYLVGSENKKIKDFFTEVYVFAGEFTPDIIAAGALSNYFAKEETEVVVTPAKDVYVDATGMEVADTVTVADEVYAANDVVDGQPTEGATPLTLNHIEAVTETKEVQTNKVKDFITNAFGKPSDALDALYNDNASGAIGHYIGCLLPEFIDPNFGYRAIDVLMNQDSDLTHLMVSLDDGMLFDEAGDPDASVILENAAVKETTYPLAPVYLEGYTYLNGKPESSTDEAKFNWQKSILDVINTEEGLRNGLLSQAEIDYRYIVDSFETFGIPAAITSMKSQLSYLAKCKELCFAILNFPSVRAMVKAGIVTSGVFDVEKAVDAITLPSESDGASFCAFYTPLKFSDGYIDTIVPSAGLVSNLFMAKYNGRQPYNIVAGPNYANIQYAQLVGPDYHYSQEELHVIEPFGVNCMIYRPTFGTFVNANQTAKQTPKSALSSVNVRELVIYLQSEIGKVLQSYQWEFNNPVTRNAIKTKADIICAQAKANGGIQQFLNVMDESNNTPDIIDNEMCVLSTHIEPGRGMGKMIHELTIYRTGGMSATLIGA